jgi:hypothetical protein
MNELPEITEVQRLTLKPGDRLVIRADEVLSAATAERLTEIARIRLGLGDDFPVFVLGQGMSLEVLEPPGGSAT